jgi:hypothetical protein
MANGKADGDVSPRGRMFGYGRGMTPQCIKRYFDDPGDITACAASGIDGICAGDCGIYRSRAVGRLAAFEEETGEDRTSPRRR